MIPTIRTRGLAIIAAAIACAPVTALADARTDARRHFQIGMELITANQLTLGISELQRAHEILPHPNVLFNIGRAYLALGDLDSALEHFEGYVSSDPPDRAEIESLTADLRRRIEAQRQRPAQQPTVVVRADGAELPQVTPEDFEALEESALQIETLAEVVEGPDTTDLREDAERLRRLAGELETLNAEAEAPSEPVEPGEAVQPETPTEPPGAVLAEVDLDQREQLYEEQVVSASRAIESPIFAPNSVAIITAQDLRMSGHFHIPEVLRRAAGVEVMRTNVGHSEVNVRGFNSRLNPRMLVLIDGRSAYFDFIGTTFWSTIPVSVEDIERIEIIRGPASALYGADAFSGVVNILTRDPGSGASQASVQVGNADTARATTSVTGRLIDDRLSYRFFAGYEQADDFAVSISDERPDAIPFTEDPDLGLQRTWAGSQLRYHFGKGYYLRGGTALSSTDFAYQSRGNLRNSFAEDTIFAQSHLSMTTPFGLAARVYWNHITVDETDNSWEIPGGIPQTGRDLRNEVIDAELELARSFNLIVDHELVVGAGYRAKYVRYSFLDDEHFENHFSAFLQDSLQLTSWLQIVASARVDRHPLIDDVLFAPRGAVIVGVTDRSAFRLQAGSAFRTPSFVEQYVALQTGGTGVRAVGLQARGGVLLDVPLKAERITSYEVGYLNQDLDILSFEVAAYYNEIEDLTELQFVEAFTLGDWVAGEKSYDPVTQSYPFAGLGFHFEPSRFRQLGGEVGIRLYPVDGLDVYANYAIADTEPLTPEILGIRADDQRTSLHKVNAGVQYRAPFGLELAIDLHYSSAQVWIEPAGTTLGRFELPAYALVNARVAQRLLDDRLVIGVSGFNLTGNDQRQHPFALPLDTRVMAFAGLTF